MLWTKLAPLLSPLHISRHNGWDRVRKPTSTRRENVALDYAWASPFDVVNSRAAQVERGIYDLELQTSSAVLGLWVSTLPAGK